MAAGKLYFVATPIGNLGDITLRALETLKQVDFVASEDTRHTGVLLKHFEISKPQIAFHEHNERQAAPRIIQLLEEGKSVALVTCAGMPGISDPGFILVRDAIAAGIEITAIPGADGVRHGPGPLGPAGPQLHVPGFPAEQAGQAKALPRSGQRVRPTR